MAFGETLQEVERENLDYKAQKTKEREEVGIIANNGIMLITSVPEAYKAYLDLQAANPRIKPVNLGIVMDSMTAMENPENVVVKQYNTWRKLGRNVKSEEKGIKAYVSEKFTDDKGRRQTVPGIGYLFDISQTSGKPLPPKPRLAENTPQMNDAFKALIRFAPVSIQTSPDISSAAVFKPENMTITVNDTKGDFQIFSELVGEIAHAALCAADRDNYDRNNNIIDADSISYMVCKRFGVPCEQPDVSQIYDMYCDATVEERRGVLDGLKDLADRTGYAVEKAAFPELHQNKQKNKAPRSNEGR